tara:strand:+ start:129 stop:353 length:225 start_codon:yes stop_codon:yes gene_type:complete
MGFLMPKAPAMPAIPEPKPLPEPPSYEDQEREEEAKRKRAAIRRNRKGRSSTILTTADGLEDNELTTKKKLLGE